MQCMNEWGVYSKRTWSGSIYSTSENFWPKLKTSMGCSYLCKITKFIRLLLTFTKLCHIKCCHLGKFYILLEKNAISLQQYDQSWHSLALWYAASLKCTGRWKVNFENQRWRMVDTLERPVLHLREISQFSVFEMVAVRHLGLLKLKFLTSMDFRLQGHVLYLFVQYYCI